MIGVATGHGEQVLRHKGLADEPRLREERVRWSLLEGQTILARFQARSQVGDRFVMWGTRPQGDGFRIEMTGDDLSQAERDELLTLPGRIDVTTGAGAGGELS